MTKKAQIINSSLDGTPEIHLRGAIDDYEDGSIAMAIDYCSEKRLRMLVNSTGGNVALGQEVIAAMQSFKDNGGVIETVNRGMAGSTAGWIFSAGSKGHRKMMPFATLFMHPPSFSDGTTIQDYQQGSEKYTVLMEAMEKIVCIFSPITGKSNNFIRNKMVANTKYSAERAVRDGFADEVVKISNSVDLKKDLKPEEVINATESINYAIISNKTKKSEFRMEELAVLLNLNPEASKGAMLQAVRSLINRADTAEAGLTAKETEVQQKDAEMAALRNELSVVKDAEIVNYVKSYIGDDVTKKGQEDKLLNMAKADFDTFKAICPVVSGGAAVIDNGISTSGDDDKNDGVKDAKKFFNMTMAEKAVLKNSNPSEYRKLVNAYDSNFDKIV